MEITYQTFLIVCPFLFLAGLIDAIGGGGGLISLPAYLIAGLCVKLGGVRTGVILWAVALAVFAGAVFVIKTLTKNKETVIETAEPSAEETNE